MSPMIPKGEQDLPVVYEVMNEDTIVRAVCRSAKVADKTDKNNKHYAVFEWEVLTPQEFEGRNITDNYVAFMDELTPDMSDAQRRKALERGVRFNRITASCGVKLDMIPTNPVDDLDEVNQFLEDNFVGAESEFTVSINEFQGRKSNKVKEYLIVS